jgi:hypothetical protein
MSPKPCWRRIAFSDPGKAVVIACCLLAEVYLARDLPATATKDAVLHECAGGYLCAGDSTVHRLPLRPARWLDAFNPEEANQSGGAKQARGQPARVAVFAGGPAPLIAT